MLCRDYKESLLISFAVRSGNGSKQPTFLAVTATLLLLSVCVVCARYALTLLPLPARNTDSNGRLYARIKHAKSVGLDDGFVAAAVVFAIALGIMNGFHISYGAG